MKTNNCLVVLAALWAGLVSAYAAAESTAVVKADRINVRGMPSLVGEVITQLKGGETITILEEIKVEKPKTGEPAAWLRIQMPPNTPVWVNAPFIDATNKTVLARRLNVRAGPGENFSVVGVLAHGESVKEIRVADNWMEIETPPKAYAFIAAEYVTKPEAAATVTAPPPPVTPKPEVAKLPPPPPPPVPMIVETVAKEAPPAKAIDQTPPPAPETAPPAVPALITMPSPPTVAATPPPAPALVIPPAAPAKRIVTRQGIVRSTTSIQAPTYYELINVETRKTVNYLHSTSTNIFIKNFRGQVVVASGEEVIDPRWPTIPVLEVESLHLVP